MKITIDLTGIADEVDWKFYQSLGGILQSHMIELIQSGNLSLPLLGDIYRRISDHLAESEGAKLPRSADLADAVFQSFLGDETENILTASLNDMTAPQSFSGDGNEMKLLSQWGLMDEVRKTQADIKCEQIRTKLGRLMQQRPINFDAVCECLCTFANPVQWIISQVEELCAQGRAIVVVSRNDWLVSASDDEISNARSVIEWREVLRISDVRQSVRELLREAVFECRPEAIDAVELAFGSLPAEARGRTDINFGGFRDSCREYADFRKWLRFALVEGVFRVDVERKLNDEFPSLIEITEGEILVADAIFHDIRVKKVKVKGRIFFQQL